MAPVIVILLSPLVLREKPGRGQLICSAAAVCGAVLISGAAGGGSFRGIALGLSAAALYAAIVLTNRFIRGLESLVITLSQLGIAAVCMVGYNLASGALQGLSLGGREIGILALLAVVHTGIAYLLYFGSLQGLPAQRAAIMSYIDPVVAVLLSALLLHQAMSVPQIVGTVLILGAALVSELLPKK
jgi:drug/metabolite transporter (DMT)-like permease